MLIGISGRKRSGKDVICNYLIKKHGFVRLGFSDALKDEVARTLPRTLEAYCMTVYGRHNAELVHRLLHTDRDDMTRCLLQEWGTELRRAENPGYWVEKWERAYCAIGGNVCTPDVRFPNEASAIKRFGGLLVKVSRPPLQDHDTHASEGWCDEFHGWDAEWVNDKWVADLEGQVEGWMDGLLRCPIH